MPLATRLASHRTVYVPGSLTSFTSVATSRPRTSYTRKDVWTYVPTTNRIVVDRLIRHPRIWQCQAVQPRNRIEGHRCTRPRVDAATNLDGVDCRLEQTDVIECPHIDPPRDVAVHRHVDKRIVIEPRKRNTPPPTGTVNPRLSPASQSSPLLGVL